MASTEPSLGSLWGAWAAARLGAVGGLAGRVLNRGRTAADNLGPSAYFSPRTSAGVYVDAERALAQATVWACITYLSRMVAQLPWHVMVPKTSGRGSDKATNHPVDWILNVRPNPELGSFTFRQTMMGTALRWGNAYAEIQRDMRGIVVGLWPLYPGRVQPCRDEAGVLFYRVDNARGGKVDMDAGDIFHVRGFGDGPVGMNVIAYAAQSIGWAQATELFGAQHYGEGMNPSGVVSIPGNLSPPALKILQEHFAKLYKGPRGERTAFLDGGMTWTRLTENASDAQQVETLQFQVETICRWFGVPPHKVQHLLRATFTNIESQNIEVVTDTIVPWVRIWEDEANYKLFGANRPGLFTKMVLNGLLRGDSAARAQFYKAMRELGAFSINDILELEDHNQIGPEGDVRFIPANMITLERAIKLGKAPLTAPAPDPAVAPADPSPGATNGRSHLNGHGPHHGLGD